MPPNAESDPTPESHGAAHADTRDRLDLLSDVGCGLLEAGETSGQTERTVRGLGAALGLHGLTVAALGRTLLVEADAGQEGRMSVTAAARSFDQIDCTRARELNRIIERTASADRGPVDRATIAREAAQVQRVRNTATPWWVVCLGMTLLAFFISMQVGVTVQAWVSAALLQLVSTALGLAITRLGPPRVFTIAVQSAGAGAVATLLVQLGFVDPVGAAAAIAVNWLLLLPLPQVIGAVADAIETDFLSAVARVAGVAVAALGIFIGAAFTFTLGEVLGMEHPSLDALPSLPWYLVLIFSALGALANAFANGGRLPLVAPAALLGLTTGAVNQLLIHVVGLPALWASSFSAIVLGVLSAILAARTGYPQQVLALMGITGALLPGIPVFFGILRQMGGASGAEHFGTAAAISVGIGTGVALGSYLARSVSAAGARSQASGSPTA